MSGLIQWVGDNRRGYFEVDGVRTEVPPLAELPEIDRRLIGRTICRIEDHVDAYVLRLDDNQVVEILGIWRNNSSAGVGIRFWNLPAEQTTRQLTEEPSE